MSWVRWSSNVSKGVNSDLYIYDHCDGYVAVHVAGRKRKSLKPLYEIPEEAEWDSENTENFWKLKNISDDWWDEDKEGINWDWEYLPEKWRGETLDFVDMDSLIDTLKEMRKDGIAFPDYIFENAEDAKKEYGEEK